MERVFHERFQWSRMARGGWSGSATQEMASRHVPVQAEPVQSTTTSPVFVDEATLNKAKQFADQKLADAWEKLDAIHQAELQRVKECHEGELKNIEHAWKRKIKDAKTKSDETLEHYQTQKMRELNEVQLDVEYQLEQLSNNHKARVNQIFKSEEENMQRWKTNFPQAFLLMEQRHALQLKRQVEHEKVLRELKLEFECEKALIETRQQVAMEDLHQRALGLSSRQNQVIWCAMLVGASLGWISSKW